MKSIFLTRIEISNQRAEAPGLEFRILTRNGRDIWGVRSPFQDWPPFQGLPWPCYKCTPRSSRSVHVTTVLEGGWYSRDSWHSLSCSFQHTAHTPSLKHLSYRTLRSHDYVLHQTELLGSKHWALVIFMFSALRIRPTWSTIPSTWLPCEEPNTLGRALHGWPSM